jgi:sec-independent protein translocase protein TatA
MNVFIIGVMSAQHILVIAAVALLFFGGKKIPELMKGLGQGMKEFKKATQETPEENKKDQSKIEH